MIIPQLQWILPLKSKPFKLNLRYLEQSLYRSGERYWMNPRLPLPKFTAVAWYKNEAPQSDTVHTMKPWMFQGQLRNSRIPWFAGLIDVRWKERVWNRLIVGMGRPIDMERKWCESSIHDHDIDYSVAIVGLMDVLDSHRGDFRRRCAVGMSRFLLFWAV